MRQELWRVYFHSMPPICAYLGLSERIVDNFGGFQAWPASQGLSPIHLLPPIPLVSCAPVTSVIEDFGKALRALSQSTSSPGLSGPVWAWAHVDPSGPIWVYLGLSGPIGAYLGLSGPIWAYLGLSEPIWA